MTQPLYHSSNPDERFLNPGSLTQPLLPTGNVIVRPRISGGASRRGLVRATDWRVVTQANPLVVPPATPIIISAFSNAMNSFDSTTIGKKTIVYFGSEQVLASGETAVLRIGTNDLFETVGATIQDVLPLGGVEDFELYLRVRLITADFDPTILCWDNTVTTPILTYGSWLAGSGYARCRVTPSVGATLNFNTFTVRTSAGLILSGPLSFYGCIVDCKLESLSSYAPTLITMSWAGQTLDYPEAPHLIYF